MTVIFGGDYGDLKPEPLRPYDRLTRGKRGTGYTCECGAQLMQFRGTNMLTCEKCGENRWLIRPST